MFTQRQTAFKVSIKDILNSKYFHEEGSSAYIDLGGVKVGRVRVIATVMQKFLNEKGGSLVIDDNTETLRARVFENADKILGDVNVGDLIELFGRVREYNEELYIIIEIIKKINDPNWFILRSYELRKDASPQANTVSTPAPAKKEEESENEVNEEKILKAIKQSTEKIGAPLKEIVEKTKLEKEEVINTLKKLLLEGQIFEPRKEKFKVVD